MPEILTIEQVRKSLMVDDDFDTVELTRLAVLASSFIKQRTGYDFTKDTSIHPLAIQCGELYVRQQYYNGAGDYNQTYDFSVGINSLIVDLQCISSSMKSAKKVIDLIAVIVTPITLLSYTSIMTARIAYDSLFDQEKEYVTNYSTLTAAELALIALES